MAKSEFTVTKEQFAKILKYADLKNFNYVLSQYKKLGFPKAKLGVTHEQKGGKNFYTKGFVEAVREKWANRPIQKANPKMPTKPTKARTSKAGKIVAKIPYEGFDYSSKHLIVDIPASDKAIVERFGWKIIGGWG